MICFLLKVTILILIDGFLQFCFLPSKEYGFGSHNPYFNRWFSAIIKKEIFFPFLIVTILILIDGFLQYNKFGNFKYHELEVTILILIDGFLQ